MRCTRLVALLLLVTSAAQAQTSTPSEQAAPPAETPAPAPAEPEYSRYRFGPTLSVLLVGFAPNPNGDWVGLGLPSVRTGLRFATLERSIDKYSFNLAVALELGGERFRSSTQGPWYAWAVTLRGGPAAVTRNGLFVPFFDAYGLATLGLVKGSPALKLGVGAHFNTFAIVSGMSARSSRGGGDIVLLGVLALLTPSVEFVWTPPNVLAPNEGWLELRVGAGF